MCARTDFFLLFCFKDKERKKKNGERGRGKKLQRGRGKKGSAEEACLYPISTRSASGGGGKKKTGRKRRGAEDSFFSAKGIPGENGMPSPCSL